jgi:hypothetical protein
MMFDFLKEQAMSAILSMIGPAIITALVPFIVQAVKGVLPSIPKWLLPIVAAISGPAVDAGLSALDSAHPTNTILALVAGLAGTGLHQVWSQIQSAFSSTTSAPPDSGD